MTVVSTGSLHDPHSRVVDDGRRILRLLDADGLDDFETFRRSPAYAAMADRLVATTELPAVPDGMPEGDWVTALEHQRVPVITYPFEWTFSMLRDAALLHLDLVARAMDDGLITKDATPYNVQFIGSRPVFIDIGSFEAIRPGEPWYGYRQFCQMFLNPLLLQSVTGVGFQTWMQGTTEGLSPVDTARLLPRRTRLRPSVFPHVTAHAWAERRYSDAPTTDVKGEMRSAGMGPAVLRGQVRRLRKLVERLRWKDGESTWSGYSDRAHYTDADLGSKEEFVREVAGQRRRTLVLDIGANDGHFSDLVLDDAEHVVALDLDAVVVERLYRRLRDRDEGRILPIRSDLTDLAGGQGWAGRQRANLLDRVRPDLVLALAVIHHLSISRSIPLGEVLRVLADLRSEMVIEFPQRHDPMVERLLGQKQSGSVQDYSQATFDRHLGELFEVVRAADLPSGTRRIYHVRPRT